MMRSTFNEKRMSRDDMSLSGQMGMSAGRTKGLQPYRFGNISGNLPTPEPSPNRMPSPPPLASIPYRTPTPNSLSSGEIQIGMALGSPTATTYSPSPLVNNWQQPQALTPPEDRFERYSPLPRQRSRDNIVEREKTPEPPVAQRQKTQKRKFFGSLFGRKQAEPAKTPEPLEPVEIKYSTPLAAASNSSLNRAEEATPLRSNTTASKKTPKFKPLMTRSRTESDMENKILEAQTQQVPEFRVADVQPSFVDTTPSLSLGGPGLLDIEIPDIRLERYSIMFSGVLNPQGAGTSSSLLARRQATLEKLKSINDKIVSEELAKENGLVRRATSPHVSKSPAFSLFPPPQGHQTRTSPRLRSNTSPAVISPVRPSFDMEAQGLPERLHKQAKRVTIVSPRAMDERNRAANVERLREQQIEMQKAQQARATHTFGPEESALFLDSPQSDVSDVEEIVPAPVSLKPRIQEPQWEIVSPPSTSTLSEASSTKTKRTTASSASSVQTTLTRPSIEIKSDDDEEEALKAAVEISIARQISISRQQRNLLRTTTTGPLPTLASGTMKRSVSAAKTSPRVVETKQSMPRLVDMHREQYRKSERVVLEAA
ncbi:hypothetical protein OQA88_12817 [Cercophora sp. LCS_1]